jgi:ADP-ribosylglycohydrolase
MLGAIIGDTVGSVYEFENIKTTEFDLFAPDCDYTDDSVMTMAVADWLLNDKTRNTQALVDTFVYFANKYPCPMGGYGSGFHRWLTSPDISFDEAVRDDGTKYIAFKEMRKPYNSWGNGSAMRTSAVGWMFDILEETERIAALQAGITHNHPEGIKGAQAVSAAIFMARNGMTKEDIKLYIENKYGYDLSKTCDEIRPYYEYNESCQGTVPQAMIAFFESTDFESCLRLAVSLGGDCDTLTCIAAGMAEAFYKDIPQWIITEMWNRLPLDFKMIIHRLNTESNYSIIPYIPTDI